MSGPFDSRSVRISNASRVRSLCAPEQAVTIPDVAPRHRHCPTQLSFKISTMSIPTCKAPDPDTHKPKYRPPAGACDAHCHIFGPGDRYPYAPDRTYTPPDAPLSRLKELQSILGL